MYGQVYPERKARANCRHRGPIITVGNQTTRFVSRRRVFLYSFFIIFFFFFLRLLATTIYCTVKNDRFDFATYSRRMSTTAAASRAKCAKNGIIGRVRTRLRRRKKKNRSIDGYDYYNYCHYYYYRDSLLLLLFTTRCIRTDGFSLTEFTRPWHNRRLRGTPGREKRKRVLFYIFYRFSICRTQSHFFFLRRPFTRDSHVKF